MKDKKLFDEFIKEKIKNMNKYVYIPTDLKPKTDVPTMFDTNYYFLWNQKRICNMMSYYGENFFKGKKILEMGCGWAYLGAYFDYLGAEVTVSDAREEHIKVVKERYPQLTSLVVDSDSLEWEYPEEKYDIIIHFGLLYHLSDPANSIKIVSERCDNLLLETEVLNSNDPTKIQYNKEETEWNKGGWGMAHNKLGSTPSYAYVEEHLKKNGMKFILAPNAEELNSIDVMATKGVEHPQQDYTWERKNTGEWRSGQRQMWYCEKIKNGK